MNERRVKKSVAPDVRENVGRRGIRGMKEWQGEKVEEVGEEGTSGRGFRGGKQEKAEGGSMYHRHTHTRPEGFGFSSFLSWLSPTQDAEQDVTRAA